MTQTRLVLAYDTEQLHSDSDRGRPSCLEAWRSIAPVHRQENVPATVFLVANLLNDVQTQHAYRRVLDSRWFKVESHTYDHIPVREHQLRPGHIPDRATRRRQVVESKRRIEEVFGRLVHGFRSAWGFPDGLRGDPELLGMLEDAGYFWSSSLLWGEGCTLPAPLNRPFNYSEEDYEKFWELPGHGYHENILKGHSQPGQSWSSLVRPLEGYSAAAFPQDRIKTPEEEIAVNAAFIDCAIEMGMPYVSFIWHPWSLFKFDPGMRMLRQTIAYARVQGMEFSTYHKEYLRLISAPQTA